MLPGAVLASVASSHLRVGSFQYAAATGDVALLRRLADHAIARHHPEAAQADQPYLALFQAVVTAQASLVARWMHVGFIHGVMNTDNMTISGETIDYGPCAFMEAYDPATVYSSIDHRGRYAYGNQPWWRSGIWRGRRDPAAAALRRPGARGHAGGGSPRCVRPAVQQRVVSGHAGQARPLRRRRRGDRWPADRRIVRSTPQSHVDYTSFFRSLGAAARGDAEPAQGQFLDISPFDDWSARWLALGPDAAAMDQVNPVYIPRNHLVEGALAAATDGDLDPLEQLLDAVTSPYDERHGLERYAEGAPSSSAHYQTFCGT